MIFTLVVKIYFALPSFSSLQEIVVIIFLLLTFSSLPAVSSST